MILLLASTALLTSCARGRPTAEPEASGTALERPRACTLEDIVGGSCPPFATHAPEDEVDHPVYGAMVRNEILIVFDPDVPAVDAFALIETLPADVRAYDPDLNHYTVRLRGEASDEGLVKIISALPLRKSVRAAAPNALVDTP